MLRTMRVAPPPMDEERLRRMLSEGYVAPPLRYDPMYDQDEIAQMGEMMRKRPYLSPLEAEAAKRGAEGAGATAFREYLAQNKVAPREYTPLEAGVLPNRQYAPLPERRDAGEDPTTSILAGLAGLFVPEYAGQFHVGKEAGRKAATDQNYADSQQRYAYQQSQNDDAYQQSVAQMQMAQEIARYNAGQRDAVGETNRQDAMRDRDANAQSVGAGATASALQSALGGLIPKDIAANQANQDLAAFTEALRMKGVNRAGSNQQELTNAETAYRQWHDQLNAMFTARGQDSDFALAERRMEQGDRQFDRTLQSDDTRWKQQQIENAMRQKALDLQAERDRRAYELGHERLVVAQGNQDIARQRLEMQRGVIAAKVKASPKIMQDGRYKALQRAQADAYKNYISSDPAMVGEDVIAGRKAEAQRRADELGDYINQWNKQNATPKSVGSGFGALPAPKGFNAPAPAPAFNGGTGVAKGSKYTFKREESSSKNTTPKRGIAGAR